MPPLFLTEMSETPAETPDIVGSWITYDRMVSEGVGPASLEVLLGLAPAPLTVEEAAPVVEALPVVDVRTLLYQGERALARVRELRTMARQASPQDLPALFEEVCDLVDLAAQPSA
jgi:hypothetical protein